ncbi:MAG: hypothetical protein L0027_10400 [Candidatus Rokubacteria bacterium]|nr:hypothetical protein [Candidatus Rokubacteria bacterium]
MAGDRARLVAERSAPAAGGGSAAALAALERAMADGAVPALGGAAAGDIEEALRALGRKHGADAVHLLGRLAEGAADKGVRKSARRELYRLEQAGIRPPANPAAGARPVLARERERAVRAWLSGIDGSGSRAVWIVFEGGLGGGLQLCSLILNDETGIVETAGGPVTRKRLEIELRRLHQDQKLPWVESSPERARSLVGEALTVHASAGTSPPAEFTRWRRLFEDASPPELPAPVPAEPALVGRGLELLALPELAGWFADPEAISEEAVALLELRDSRLVVPDAVKAERETVIVDRVIDKTLGPDARRRLARRLREMALVLEATGRAELAGLAAASAAAVGDLDTRTRAIPLLVGMAERGLDLGTEVALGRARLEDVRRAPRAPGQT